MYKSFAYVYDYLMADVPYDKWLAFLRDKKRQYNLEGNQVLDVACGTGELAIKLAKANFNVTGVDRSAEMLAVAQTKTFEEQLNISFFQQNMEELNSLGQFDIVTIFCDSLNYLTEQTDVQQTFINVYDHLKPGGLLLFDVHSIYKINNIFMNQTFGLNDEEVAYVWHSYAGKHKNSVEHDLTFFLFDEQTGQYERFDEYHHQRTFPIDDYVAMLAKANFNVEEITADFTKNAVENNSERIFFVAQK